MTPGRTRESIVSTNCHFLVPSRWTASHTSSPKDLTFRKSCTKRYSSASIRVNTKSASIPSTSWSILMQLSTRHFVWCRPRRELAALRHVTAIWTSTLCRKTPWSGFRTMWFTPMKRTTRMRLNSFRNDSSMVTTDCDTMTMKLSCHSLEGPETVSERGLRCLESN